MELRRVLKDVALVQLLGDPSVGVRGIAYDSRAVESDYLFAALKGQREDGNDFVEQAAARGAVAILSARPGDRRPASLSWAQVEAARLARVWGCRTEGNDPGCVSPGGDPKGGRH